MSECSLSLYVVIAVNIGQPAFEGIILVVKRVHELLCDKNDRNGRNLTLASYIQYCCTLPHPGPLQHCGKFVNTLQIHTILLYHTPPGPLQHCGKCVNTTQIHTVLFLSKINTNKHAISSTRYTTYTVK